MIDEKDWLIIEELKKDSRQSTVDIAKKTRIPRITVHERIRRLKERGVISAFTVKLNGAKIGQPTNAFVMIRALPNDKADQTKLAKEIAKIPDILEAYTIGGEWDIITRIRSRSIEEIGNKVISKIRQVKGVERTITIATFEELKNEC